MQRPKGRFLDTLQQVKRKSGRRRWTGGKKQICEEDTQYGELEKGHG